LKDEPTFFKNCRIRRFSETQIQQLQNIHFSTGNIFFIKPTQRIPHQVNADSVSLLQKSTDLYSRVNGTLRSLQIKSMIQFHGKEVQYETLST